MNLLFVVLRKKLRTFFSAHVLSTTLLCLIIVLLQFSYSQAAEPVSAPIGVNVKPYYSDVWSVYRTTTLEQLKGYNSQTISLSKYGGRMDMQEEAKGFFYTKKINGRWHLIDPDGHPYIYMGLCKVNPFDDEPDTENAFISKYGNRGEWARQTKELLIDQLHFTGLGNWSSYDEFKTINEPVPYARFTHFIAQYAKATGQTYLTYGHTGFINDVIPVFDAAFPAYADEYARAFLDTKDDPYCIGIFSDNELPLNTLGGYDTDGGIIERYLRGGTNEGAVYARNWLANKGIDPSNITSAHNKEFAHLVYTTYFQIVTEAIRRYDNNHLYLGTRFHWYAKQDPVVYEAAKPFIDVVSINHYNSWSIDQNDFNTWATWADAPILITEWYAKGEDSGLLNEAGAGWTVENQQDRGEFYQNFTISLLRNKNIVGWHWFRYIDECPIKYVTGNSNKGMLNCSFDIYQPLTDAAKAINAQAYGLQDFLTDLNVYNLPDKNEIYGEYTSNSLPGTLYQAEYAPIVSGCAVGKDYSGYVGSGFIDYGAANSYIKWDSISVSDGKTYKISFRYAATSNRPSHLLINGNIVNTIPFTSTVSWDNWQVYNVDVELKEGINTIEIKAIGNGPNLDAISITPVVDITNILEFEAESAFGQDNFAPFVVKENPSTSGGKYIENTVATSSIDETGGGYAFYTFETTATEDINFKATVNFPTGSDDSFFYKLDNGNWQTKNGPVTSGWNTVDIYTFQGVEAGVHTLTLLRREDGALIDKLILSASTNVFIVDTPSIVSVTGISLSATTLNLKTNETSTILAQISPNDATNKAVTYSSNNESLATVNQNGVVTAKAVGTAVVTVTSDADETISSECTVNITDSIVTSVSNTLNEDVQVYTNPFDKYIAISIDNTIYPTVVATLFNLSGKIVSVNQFNAQLHTKQEFVINTTSIESGIYLLKLESGSELELVKTFKLIKH